MNNPIKKVAAVHDLSGIGRASLTAIIPIFSSMGIQVCPFPTAVLSSNTGFFDDFTFIDLTDSMEAYMHHWEKMGLVFDCIYTGFLGSAKQVDIILDFIDGFKSKANMVVVDPVLGDNGKLYPTIDKELIGKMKELVKKADVITPNFTEAMYLLQKEYTHNIGENEVKGLLKELTKLGPETAVITSVPDILKSDNIDVYAYESESSKYWRIRTKYFPIEFPGAGDAFTSVLIAGLLKGDSLPIALNRSVQFISIGIKESFAYDYPNGEGILLEKILEILKTPMIKIDYELLE